MSGSPNNPPVGARDFATTRGAAMPAQHLSFSKGKVGTSGRAPIALRFDDWQNQILDDQFIENQLAPRGLFGSLALCTSIGSASINPWNQRMTWAQIRAWNQQYGMEIWSHGRTHQSPVKPSDVYSEVVGSAADLAAAGIRPMGWAHPGVTDVTQYTNLATLADFEGYAGRLLQNTFPLVETDMTGLYRHLPSELRYGLAHITISDSAAYAGTSGQNYAKSLIDTAVAMGYGLEIMCHYGNLGRVGYPSVADFLAVLDYIVTLRDAGTIEFLTPSSLAYADPGSTRRLDLIGNGNFATAVPTGLTSAIGNWNGADGTTSKVVAGVTRHDGANGPVGQTGVTAITQTIDHAAGRGAAGMTLLLDGYVTAAAGSATAQFQATDKDTPANFTKTTTKAVAAGTWTRIRVPFAAPPATVNIGLAISAAAGSGAVQWDALTVRPA